jgi:hypothetical protein
MTNSSCIDSEIYASTTINAPINVLVSKVCIRLFIPAPPYPKYSNSVYANTENVTFFYEDIIIRDMKVLMNA